MAFIDDVRSEIDEIDARLKEITPTFTRWFDPENVPELERLLKRKRKLERWTKRHDELPQQRRRRTATA